MPLTAPCQPCPHSKCRVGRLSGTPGSPWAGWVWFPILLLPLAGRVARAGRSGTAYSLVAPDEMPYVFDLHLFLGRPLVLAGAQEMPAGEGGLCGHWAVYPWPLLESVVLWWALTHWGVGGCGTPCVWGMLIEQCRAPWSCQLCSDESKVGAGEVTRCPLGCRCWRGPGPCPAEPGG